MFGIVKIDLNTKEGIEKLEKIKNYNQRKKIVEKTPEVILYASKYWNNNSEDYKKIVKIALMKKPELILNFKGKDGLDVNYDYISTAILSNPMVSAKMNKEMKDMVDEKLFLKAFVKNPMILSVSDLKALKHKYSKEVENVVDGKVETKVVKTTLRTECLKAIRLAENVSNYHKQYDEFALNLANQLKKSQTYQNKKFSPELLSNFSTLMNVMIKKTNQKLRAVSVEAWKVNNGKPMYKAVRVSAKQNSQLEGLLGDMPTALLPTKVVEKLIITAIKINPNEYLNLEEYGLGEYSKNTTVKYNVYKSLKKHKMLDVVDVFLNKNDVEKSKNKLEGVGKRPKKVKRPKNPMLPAVVEEEKDEKVF